MRDTSASTEAALPGQTGHKGRARRRFLLGALVAGGALLVGWGTRPPRQRLHTSAPLPLTGGAVALNGWIAIAPDGAVSVVVPRSEMGQGVHTALPMLVAEELDAALDSVRIAPAPIDQIFGNLAVLRENLPFHPDQRGKVKDGAQWMLAKVGRELGIMFTGGSTSVKDAWQPMREAGAVARAMLVKAASDNWKSPVGDLRTEDGFVIHRDGRRASYASLAARAADVGAGIDAGDVHLKEPRDFRLIGKPLPRRDTPGKVDGSTIGHQYFPRNLGLPGMGPDKTTAEGEYDMQYEIRNQRIAHVIVDSPLPLGYWRSVGHSHNAFFKEGFMDEVAHAAGRDGVAYRRALLKEHPRHLAVMDAALRAAGAPPAGHAHGFAIHQSFGSIVAQVDEVSDEGKDIRVHRVVCAIDCGMVVNPNAVIRQ
jgi:CO/xanthine dehydrogenase Mo-binding subunit